VSRPWARRLRRLLIVLVSLFLLLVVAAVVLIHKKPGYPPSLLGICGARRLPPGSSPLPTDDLLFDANPTGHYEIYVSGPNGSGMTRLTDDPMFDSWYPRLSPDRRRILFYRTPAGVHDRDYMLTSLWMMNANGSDVTEVLSPGCYGWLFQGHAEWSPDGKSLVMFGGKANPQIYVTTIDGTDPRQVTDRPGPNVDPSWSPDGSTIVFVGCPSVPCSPPDYEIYTVPAAGGPVHRLTYDHLRDNDPRYSPNGKMIAWESETQLPSPSAPAGIWQIRVANADGSDVRTITSGHSISTNPFWSVDGARIFFYRFVYGKPKWQLWSMLPDGSDAVQITHHTSFDSEMVSQ
jgi:Tol biopolymer transport system component